MRLLATVLGMLLSVLATGAAAEDKPPLKKWLDLEEYYGPLKDTRVMKYTDMGPGYVVVCYVYVPDSVGTSRVCGGGGCSTRFEGDIGSISCVNVTQPPQPPAAEPSPAPTQPPSPANGKKQH